VINTIVLYVAGRVFCVHELAFYQHSFCQIYNNCVWKNDLALKINPRNKEGIFYHLNNQYWQAALFPGGKNCEYLIK